MGTNCAPLLADMFLYSYEAEFIQNILKSGEKKLAKQFNLTFRYIDDVLSLNNSKFSDSIDLTYPNELEVKIPQNPGTLLHIWTYNSNLTIRLIYTLSCMTNEMTFIIINCG